MSNTEVESSQNSSVNRSRYLVGSPKALYVSGKSVRPMPTLTLEQAVKAADYLSGLDFGPQVIFKLQPIDPESENISALIV